MFYEAWLLHKDLNCLNGQSIYKLVIFEGSKFINTLYADPCFVEKFNPNDLPYLHLEYNKSLAVHLYL